MKAPSLINTPHPENKVIQKEASGDHKHVLNLKWTVRSNKHKACITGVRLFMVFKLGM